MHYIAAQFQSGYVVLMVLTNTIFNSRLSGHWTLVFSAQVTVINYWWLKTVTLQRTHTFTNAFPWLQWDIGQDAAPNSSQAQTCFKVAQSLSHFLPPRSSTPWSSPHCVGLLFMQYLKLFWKVHRKTFKCFQAFLPASACWEVMDENVKQKPQRESGTSCSFRMQMFTRKCRVLAGVARQDTVEGSTQG